MGVSTNMSNTTYPISFTDSVKRNDTLTFTLFQCLRWAANGTCDFTPPSDFYTQPEPEHNMIEALIPGEDKCGKCNKTTHQCTACDCKTGGDCKPVDQCEKECGTNAKYNCNWSDSPPQCVEDPNGTLGIKDCLGECHNAQYGKCDYKSNSCVKCTPGADADCKYLMSYCMSAQKEGLCKKVPVNGVFRMLEANRGFKHAEFDLEFKDGDIHIGEFITAKAGNGFGHTKFNETAGTFEVTAWESDPNIWPHKQMFGVYKQYRGEQQVFNFLEIAFADHPITELKDGLGEFYLIGFNCMDPKVCDFSKASPHMLSNYYALNPRGQTPAIEERFFLQ